MSPQAIAERKYLIWKNMAVQRPGLGLRRHANPVYPYGVKTQWLGRHRIPRSCASASASAP